jgi:DNA-binding NtrC family response regulator
MQSILIVDDDKENRNQMAEIFIDAGYSVTATGSVANAIHGILKKLAQVVVLGSKCDDLTAVDLVPIMKRCNPKMPIILIAADLSLGLLRKLRGEGIFYCALKPASDADREEVRQAVSCAFKNLPLHPA